MAANFVFGDSLSSSENHDSWCEVLRDRGHDMRKDVMPGRTIEGYDIPRDLHGWPIPAKSIYLLGANDAIQNLFNVYTKERFDIHLHTMREKKFDVVVVLPPIFVGYEAYMQDLRQHMQIMNWMTQTPSVDLETIWDESLTTDNIHPTPALSILMADLIEPEII